MKRKRMILMLAALVLSGTMIGYAVAQERAGGERSRGGIGGEDPSSAVRRRMCTPLEKLHFKNRALKDVIQYFREVTGINIHVKWDALKVAGVDRSTKVNINYTNRTLEQVLTTILKDVGGDTPLSFVVDNGVLMISTKDDLGNRAMEKRRMAVARRMTKDPSREVHRKLRLTIPKLELPGVDFKNAIQFIREFGNVNIHVKWNNLKLVDVTKKSKVDVHLTNVTLDKAIRTILEDVGGLAALAFVVDENVITISTRENLAQAKHRAMEDRRMAAEAVFPRKRAERMAQMIGLVQRMKHVCFDSETVGVMAIGALKDEIPRKDEDIIKDLEELLTAQGKYRVQELGLRNAIRLTLKDIYKRQGNNEKVIEHIKALIAENDKALQAEEKK